MKRKEEDINMKKFFLLLGIHGILLGMLCMGGCEEEVSSGTGNMLQSNIEQSSESTIQNELTHIHAMTFVEEKAASCTEAGKKAYYWCEECENAYADEQGNEELIDLVFPATGHTYGEWNVLKIATCGNLGKRERSCACGAEERECIPLTRVHTYVEGVCSECEGLVPTEGLAYTLSEDGMYYLASGIGSVETDSIVIADCYQGLPVLEIAEEAFEWESLQSVVIPNGIEKIGASAFYGCTSLKAISLPETVVTVGADAFGNCLAMKSVAFGENVEEISSRAFMCCTSLTELIIPDSVIKIGHAAFEACFELESVSLGAGVTIIQEDAFTDCESLTSIVLPKSVTTLSGGAFAHCYALSNMSVEKGNPVYHSQGNCIIKTSTKTLVEGCKNSSIPADGSVTRIGTNAFLGCQNLTNITIPEGITHIGDMAFWDCMDLESVHLPQSVISVGDSAFAYCESLQGITVAEGNTVFEGEGNCLIRKSNRRLVLGCNDSVIPSDGGVTQIAHGAFYGSGVTDITIPACITRIEEGAFIECERLETLTVASGNTVYRSEGNCIIETAAKTLIAGCKNSVIPNDGTVTVIADDAFWGTVGLTHIVIPDGVTEIGFMAFVSCENLTSIVLPSSLTYIGDFCFGWVSPDVYYRGSLEQWNTLMQSYDGTFYGATVYFYAENDGTVTEPSKYWYYGEEGEIVPWEIQSEDHEMI